MTQGCDEIKEVDDGMCGLSDVGGGTCSASISCGGACVSLVVLDSTCGLEIYCGRETGDGLVRSSVGDSSANRTDFSTTGKGFLADTRGIVFERAFPLFVFLSNLSSWSVLDPIECHINVRHPWTLRSAIWVPGFPTGAATIRVGLFKTLVIAD